MTLLVARAGRPERRVAAVPVGDHPVDPLVADGVGDLRQRLRDVGDGDPRRAPLGRADLQQHGRRPFAEHLGDRFADEGVALVPVGRRFAREVAVPAFEPPAFPAAAHRLVILAVPATAAATFFGFGGVAPGAGFQSRKSPGVGLAVLFQPHPRNPFFR